MIKQLFKFTTAIILGLFHYTSTAQSCALNGTYTINADLPADSTNFISFTEAADKLKNCGVSGPVVINVADGIYNEQVLMDSIPGTSAANTITIQADLLNRSEVKLIYAATGSKNYVLRFSDASYIRVKGLSIEAQNTTYACVVDFEGEGKHIVLEGNSLKGVPSTPNPEIQEEVSETAIISTFNSDYSHCLFTNNSIYNGSVGIFLKPSGDTAGYGNIIGDNFIEGFGYAGIVTEYQDSIIIKNNTIKTSDNPTAQGCGSINIREGSYFEIIGNKMSLYPSPSSILMAGISVINYDSSSIAPNRIVNNTLALEESGFVYFAYGINISTEVYRVNIINNTVYNSSASAITINIVGGKGIKLVNNNLTALNGAKIFDVSADVTSNFIQMDHNNIFTTGGSIGDWGADAAADLSAWQTLTSHDSNSISMDPQFIGSADLRVYISAMDNLGTPVTGTTTDIEGNPRSTTTPDIGAYEFTAYNEDLFTSELLSPADSLCGDSNTTVSVVVFNRGASDATGFNIGAIIDGQDLFTTYSGTLASGERDTVNISGFNTAKGEMTEIQTYTNLSTDMNTANDTLSTMVYIQGSIAPEPMALHGSFCASEPYDTLYFPEGVSAYQWLATNGDTLSTSNGFIVGPLNTKDTTFILSPLGNDCSAPDGSITLEYVPAPVADFNTDLQGPTETDFTVNFDGSISSNANTFEWSFGDGSTATGDSVSHTYTADSTYEVQLIVTGACGSDTITKTVEIEGIGIEENILAQSLKIYPNPVHNKLQISFEAQSSGNTKIQIIDLSGKTVMRKEVSNNDQYNGEVDITKLSKGSYLLRIESGTLRTVKRIVKN